MRTREHRFLSQVSGATRQALRLMIFPIRATPAPPRFQSKYFLFRPATDSHPPFSLPLCTRLHIGQQHGKCRSARLVLTAYSNGAKRFGAFSQFRFPTHTILYSPTSCCHCGLTRSIFWLSFLYTTHSLRAVRGQ